jgi:methyl-accepting chemotaxis protein
LSSRNEILSIINSEIEHAVTDADSLRKTSNDSAFVSTIIFIIGTIGAALGSLLFGIYLSRSITNPLNEVMQVAEKIGQGTCSARVRFSRKDEIGTLGSALNEMGDRIRAMIEDTQLAC